MGRSSNSSHYQLSANKLISRVHVRARYVPASGPVEQDKVEISCVGWNGMKVHCHGRSWDLAKGDSFTSTTESADIMLDVQDARVFVGWPTSATRGQREESESSWAGDEENSPVKAVDALGIMLPSGQLRMGRRLRSPESPTPKGVSTGAGLEWFNDADKREVDPNATIQIFEDDDSDNEAPMHDEGDTAPFADLKATQESELSEAEEDPNEENDPIVHSFGPFGANISGRMAAFNHGTPEPESDYHASEHSSAPSSPSPEKHVPVKPVAKEEVVQAEPAEQKPDVAEAPVEESKPIGDEKPKPYISHAVNQLAYSRLSSTPLSTILQNLPKELRGLSDEHPENKGLSKPELHRALIATPCVGEIPRAGKDAAGKPLESEYYYIPDMDDDEMRRATVVDGLRKPSLRACRKQHKVSYSANYSLRDLLRCYSNITGRSHAHHRLETLLDGGGYCQIPSSRHSDGVLLCLVWMCLAGGVLITKYRLKNSYVNIC